MHENMAVTFSIVMHNTALKNTNSYLTGLKKISSSFVVKCDLDMFLCNFGILVETVTMVKKKFFKGSSQCCTVS